MQARANDDLLSPTRSDAPLVRYAFVAAITLVALAKFTAAEAEGIRPFVEHSPLLSWAPASVGMRSFTIGLGMLELAIAALIALRPLSARAALVGSVGAIMMFLTTLSFLFTAPGVLDPSSTFPVFTAVGGFLAKDAVFLGIAVWSAREAYAAVKAGVVAPRTEVPTSTQSYA